MKPLILVVDDEPDVEPLFRQRFRSELREGRFHLDFAPGAERAMELIAGVDDNSLVLVLSDISMPGMNGLELLPRVKTARPDVSVIMITAYGDSDTERRALDSGADALLSKPIDFASLRSRIENRLRAIA